MSQNRSAEWRFSTRALFPIAVAGCAAALLVAVVLLFATRESDQVALERQTRLVTHVLKEQLAKITHDQQSVTIWDESIRQTEKAEIDLEWFDGNFGPWLYTYFGHDRSYVLNRQDKPIYA